MIVIARGYGQLGNRLFLYGHFIAAAAEYGVRVANPCFAQYAHLFPATEKDLWCRYPEERGLRRIPSLRLRQLVEKGTYLSARGLSNVGLGRAPIRVIRIKGEQSIDLADQNFASIVSRRHVMAQGWLFRCHDLIQRHADKVRAHFRIAESHQLVIDRLIAGLRNQSDVVVGVHIRHGDYATFMGGKYFFTVSQYAAVMRGIADQLAPQRISFLVCGNGELDRRPFEGLKVQFGTGDIIEDLYALAEVDLLIGPPSTFTGWASFYGDVPLVEITSADVPLDISPLVDRINAESHVRRVA